VRALTAAFFLPKPHRRETRCWPSWIGQRTLVTGLVAINGTLTLHPGLANVFIYSVSWSASVVLNVRTFAVQCFFFEPYLW
jgi:hypothetical protein